MSKKRRLYKILLRRIISYVNFLISINSMFMEKNTALFYQNIFRITTSYKQLFFSLLNYSTEFTKLFSTGQTLKRFTRNLKFFKKSINNINPLVMHLRFLYVDFFKNMYLIECLNYSKKQYLFLKKLLSSLNSKLRFLIFKKTWQYTTQPVKRIKRRVVKLLKNL